eukprot:4401712-Pyramimonas_sp.AAC.1
MGRGKLPKMQGETNCGDGPSTEEGLGPRARSSLRADTEGAEEGEGSGALADPLRAWPRPP